MQQESLINKVKRNIQEKNLLKYDEHFLVACSGGMDSVCLTEVLRLLAPVFRWQIFVGHVNHHIRGAEAKEDELWVGNFCRTRGLSFFTADVDAPKFASETGHSLEEAARILRYEALEKMAADNGLSDIVTAHQQEDNAETILMNILRGSGIDGVTGIKEKRVNIVRPLLQIPRSEIETFCRDNKMHYRTDSSNKDTRHLRNKVRLELLPILKKYNPQVVQALCRLGEMFSRDADFLTASAQKTYLELRREQEGFISLPLPEMQALDQAMSSRVVLLVVKDGLRDAAGAYINNKHLKKILELIKDGRTGAVLELPGGLLVKKEYTRLVFSTKPFADTAQTFLGEYVLPVPGRITLPDKRILRASIFRGGRPGKGNSQKAVFPVSVAEGGLKVRGRCPGDVFKPSGMNGSTRKLKEFLIDSKVPLEQRDKIPLVFDSEGILWVAGLRGAHREETSHIEQWLYLELLAKEYINV